MSIQSEVASEMKAAMKAKDTVALATLRSMKASFTNLQKELGTEADLTDEQAITVLRKLAKQRQESIDMYTKGGATEQASAELAELAIIERWLPSLADEETTRRWIEEAIAEAGEDGGNMGKVMGKLMASHKGDVDGKLAQKLLKEML